MQEKGWRLPQERGDRCSDNVLRLFEEKLRRVGAAELVRAGVADDPCFFSIPQESLPHPSKPPTRSESETRRLTGEKEGVDVLAVVAEGHTLLAEANGVLARRNAVESLEIRLGDAAQREVDVDGVWLGVRSREWLADETRRRVFEW